jgi:N utilization substance protein A
VEGLFKREVPEVAQGVVELRVVAREAGMRTKIAVFSSQSGVDPVGSCVGQKGVRVQAVINELGNNEKVDIIQWSDNSKQFIASALAPAKDVEVVLFEDKKIAEVYVSEDQLSLAIGRDGGNVRLAAKLTGWKIDVKKKSSSVESSSSAKATEDKSEDKSKDTSKREESVKDAKTNEEQKSDEKAGDVKVTPPETESAETVQQAETPKKKKEVLPEEVKIE